MAAGSINFTIAARDAASGAIKNVQSNIKTMAKGFVIAAAAIASAVGAAATALTAFGISAVKAAMEDAAAQRLLTSTLEARGLANERNLALTEKAIEAGARLAFTDDEIRGSIATATQFTNKFGHALKIQAVAQDLARAKGISLERATALVGRAYAGSNTALSKYGVTIAKGTRGLAALDAAQGSFSGQAEAYGETLQGQFGSLQITLAETKEAIGGALLPALTRTFKGVRPVIDDIIKTVIDSLPDLKRFADNFTKNIPNLSKQAWANIKKNLPEIIQKVKDFGTGVLDLLGKAKDFIGTDGSITVGLATIGAKLGGFGGALTAVFSKGFSDLGFGPIESGIAGAVTAGLTGSIAKAAMDTFVQIIMQKIVAANIASRLLPGGGVPMPTTVPGVPAAIPAAGAAASTIGGVAVAGVVAVAGAAAAVAAIAGIAALAYSALVPKDVQAAISANLGAYAANQNAKGAATGAGGTYSGGGTYQGGVSDYTMIRDGIKDAGAAGVATALQPVAAYLGRDVNWTANLKVDLDGREIATTVDKYLGVQYRVSGTTRNGGR